jgi:hypothetical protein
MDAYLLVVLCTYCGLFFLIGSLYSNLFFRLRYVSPKSIFLRTFRQKSFQRKDILPHFVEWEFHRMAISPNSFLQIDHFTKIHFTE